MQKNFLRALKKMIASKQGWFASEKGEGVEPSNLSRSRVQNDRKKHAKSSRGVKSGRSRSVSSLRGPNLKRSEAKRKTAKNLLDVVFPGQESSLRTGATTPRNLFHQEQGAKADPAVWQGSQGEEKVDFSSCRILIDLVESVIMPSAF